MAAEIYDLTPDRILERLEQYRANCGMWPAVRDIGGHGRWPLADLAGRLHDMERQGLVACDPGRVYRPRGAAPNPPQLMEVTTPVETQVPAPRATKARPGRRAIQFPPPEQLLAEAEAALAAGENAVAVLGARYGAVKSTTRNRLRRAHIHVHGINAPPPWWTPNRRPRPMRAALTMTEAEAPPLQDAQPARVEATGAMAEGGQGGNIPEVVTGAQGVEGWIDFTPTTTRSVRVKVARLSEDETSEDHGDVNDIPYAERHPDDKCECGGYRYQHPGGVGPCIVCARNRGATECESFRLVLRHEPDETETSEAHSDSKSIRQKEPLVFDGSKIDFVGMTETAPDPEAEKQALKAQVEAEIYRRPRPWTSSTVVPLPLLLRLLLEEIEDDQVLRRVLKRVAGEVA